MSTSHFHFNSGSLPTAGATDDSNTDFNDDMLLLDTAPADDTLMSSDMLLLNPQPDAALLNANNNNNNMDMDLDNATSTAKLIQLLTQWWINEKTSPAILPFQFEVVEPLADCLLERVHRYLKKSLLNNNSKADAVASSRQNIRSTDALVCAELMELEVERIKYLLKSYLLARLRKVGLSIHRSIHRFLFKKVELFADEISAAVNKSPLLQDCLSQPELEYAQRYTNIRK